MSTTIERFGRTTTAQQVADRFKTHALGRTFLITGAAGGIGLETARALASVGAKVTLAARSQSQAEKAVADVRGLLGSAGASADLSALELDLSSVHSVKKGALEFLARVPKLDVLINNAGVMAAPLTTTKDGLEMQFGVNHVGHHLLTSLLMPALIAAGTPAAPARVVNLSSMGHYLFTEEQKGIVFEHLDPPDAKTYKQWVRYGETKLANVWHAAELTRRCAAANQPVIGVSLHPGAILATNLSRHMGLSTSVGMVRQMTTWSALYLAMFGAGYKNIPQGASTTLVAALDPAVEAGKYYVNCEVERKWVQAQAYNPELTAKLWEYTEQLLARLMGEGHKR